MLKQYGIGRQWSVHACELRVNNIQGNVLRRALVRTGLASKACAEYNQPDADGAFINGNVSMAFIGPWNIADIQHDNPSLNYGVVEPPAGPAGRATFSGGSNLAILAGSKKQADAKAWIEFLIRKDNLVSYTRDLTNMLPATFLFTVACNSAVGADGVDVAITATARNMVSAWNVGRYNEVIDVEDMRGIVFRSDSPLPSDGAAGTVCLATPPRLGHVTCEPEWNMKTADPFSLTLENEDLSAIWKSFATDGSLFWAGQGDRPRSAVVRGEGIELGGAVAIKATLLPGQVWTVPFVLAWHMPKSDVGHIYENDFADACEAACCQSKEGADSAADACTAGQLNGRGMPICSTSAT